MKFARLAYIFAFVICLSVAVVECRNVGCGAYPYTVITHKDYKFIPLAVNITRCLGKDTQHMLMRCMPTLTKNISISTYTFEGTPGTAVIVNHLLCKERCTIDASACNQYQYFSKSECQCMCKQTTPPVSCKSPFKWDKTLCNCMCIHNKDNYKCEKKKIFNVSECSCVCNPKHNKICTEQPKKLFNPLNCECQDLTLIAGKSESLYCKNGILSIVVIAVVLFEAAVLFLSLFFCTRYCDAKKREETMTFKSSSVNSIKMSSNQIL